MDIFSYNLNGLEGNELASQLHEQEGKGEKAGNVGSFLAVVQVP